MLSQKQYDEIKHIIYQFEAKFLLIAAILTVSPKNKMAFMAKWINKRMIKSKNLVPEHCQTPPFPRIPFQIATSQDAITALVLGIMDITESQRESHVQNILVGRIFLFSRSLQFTRLQFSNLADYTQIQTPQEFVFVDTDEQGKPIKPTPYR